MTNMDSGIKIFQIYYDDKTKTALEPQFTPYLNAHCGKYFESGIIADLYDAGALSACDYAGAVSWRIRQKMRRLPEIRQFIRDDGMVHDFYYVGSKGIENVWQHGQAAHAGVECTSYTQELLKELGFDVDLRNLPTMGCYANYQICKAELYQDYVANCLKPMIALMEDKTRAPLQAWLNEDVYYVGGTLNRYAPMLRLLKTSLHRVLGQKNGIRVEKWVQKNIFTTPAVASNTLTLPRLQEITGFPHYTKHPFITERLFPTYAAIKGWTGKRYAKFY